MDNRKKIVYDFLVSNNLMPSEYELTEFDIEDGVVDSEEKFMMAASLDGDDSYATLTDSDTKEEIVIFLTEDGPRNYIHDALESGEEPFEAALSLLREISGDNYEGVFADWGMSINDAGDFKYSIVKNSSLDKRASTMNIIKHAAGTGIGPYRRGKVLTEVGGLQPGQLLVWEAIVFKAVNLVKVTEVFDEKFYGIIVKPDNPVEKAKASDEEFVVYSHDLEKGEWYLALEPAPSEVVPAAEEAQPSPEQSPEAPAATPAPAAPEGAEGPAEGAPATAEPTPEPKKGAGLKSPVKQTMDYGTPEKKAAKNPRYIFFCEENKPVAMWGEGLVKATVDGEEMSVDAALESLTADISEDVSPAVGSLVSIYVGNATYFTYDILVDYSMEDILAQLKEDGSDMTEDDVDKEIDRINDYLHKNTDVRPLTEEAAPAEETTASKKTAADEERNPSIATTYEIWDEESAEIGETDDKGWIDEEGESMLPDEFDDEDTTIVSKAVEFLQKNGANHPSSMPLAPGRTWYTNDNYNENFEKGGTEQRSYFLSGFTPEEEQEIYAQITGKKASVTKTAYGEEPATCLERKDNSSEPLRKEDMVIQKTAEDEEMTSFASYQVQKAPMELPEETVTAAKEVEADYDHFFDFDDKNFGRTASTDFIGVSGNTNSLVAGLLANIESLASATGGEGDDGSAYDLAEGRDFTGVDEHMATASVEEYLNGKAVSFASIEDFAGFVEDMYGIKKAHKSRIVEAAWHGDDKAALVSFIKQYAKKDELSA